MSSWPGAIDISVLSFHDIVVYAASGHVRKRGAHPAQGLARRRPVLTQASCDRRVTASPARTRQGGLNYSGNIPIPIPLLHPVVLHPSLYLAASLTHQSICL